jgi:hypothetical protein
MAFPHPQSRKDKDRNGDKPHHGGVVWKFFKRTMVCKSILETWELLSATSHRSTDEHHGDGLGMEVVLDGSRDRERSIDSFDWLGFNTARDISTQH